MHVRHRVVGLPDPLRMRRVGASDLWAVTTVLPVGSRVEYQVETVRGSTVVRFNDPLNTRLAHGPFGASSVCASEGYAVPEWALPDPEARAGEMVDLVVPSKALGRDQPVQVYLPARFQSAQRYPSSSSTTAATTSRMPPCAPSSTTSSIGSTWLRSSQPSSPRRTGSSSTRTTPRILGSWHENCGPT